MPGDLIGLNESQAYLTENSRLMLKILSLKQLSWLEQHPCLSVPPQLGQPLPGCSNTLVKKMGL